MCRVKVVPRVSYLKKTKGCSTLHKISMLSLYCNSLQKCKLPFTFLLTELLRRSRKMARPSSCRQRAGRSWWRRRRFLLLTAHASVCPGATLSPFSLESASASPSVSDVTWAWPSSAWSTATPSSETTRKS